MMRFPALMAGVAILWLSVMAADAPNGGTGKPDAPSVEQMKAECDKYYEDIVSAYMHSKYSQVLALLAKPCKYSSQFSKVQRDDLAFIKKQTPLYRPEWWKNCRSSHSISFQATIWGRDIDANYWPSEDLGMQAPIDIYHNKVRVIVSWKPSMVDSNKAAEGDQAKAHALTKGDIAETIVWHELGHNYLTTAMPASDVLYLYRNFDMLYMCMQEFFADLTAFYHAGPQSRKVAMFLRTDSFEWYRDSEAHTRAAYGIGSLIMTNVLMEPNKWPSVHFPGNIPDEDVERNTLIYMYDHIATTWTLNEDRALQKMVGDFVTKQGDWVFRHKGTIPLPNKLQFQLMATDDRDDQEKRDDWVKGKLEEMKKNGSCDAPVEAKKHDLKHIPMESTRVVIPW